MNTPKCLCLNAVIANCLEKLTETRQTTALLALLKNSAQDFKLCLFSPAFPTLEIAFFSLQLGSLHIFGRWYKLAPCNYQVWDMQVSPKTLEVAMFESHKSA